MAMDELIHFENFTESCHNYIEFGKYNSSDTCNKDWLEDCPHISEQDSKSRLQIKKMVLEGTSNRIIEHIRFETQRLVNIANEFKKQYKMFHVNVMHKNQWFLDLYTIIIRYSEWYSNLTLSIGKHEEKKDELEEQKVIEVKYDTSIFTSYIGFEIFDSFRINVLREKYEYADYSFLFVVLLRDKYVHDVGHKKYIEFLTTKYNSQIGEKYIQLKTSITDEKERIYTILKNQIKSKSII